MSLHPLSFDKLNNRCSIDIFDFETTDDLIIVADFVGQERARRSLEIGTGINHRGYNIFVMGRAGTGRHIFTKEHLELVAKKPHDVFDLCYVNNFKNPSKPYAITLKPGSAYEFKKDMEELINAIKRTLNEAFDSNEYQNQRRAITEYYNNKIDSEYRKLESNARALNIAMMQTPQGIVFYPINKDGKNISQEEFQQLDEETREKFSKNIIYLQEELQSLMRKVAQMRKEMDEQINKLNKNFVRTVLEPIIRDIKSHYRENPKIVKYLSEVSEDIVDNYYDFIAKENEQFFYERNLFTQFFTPSFKRYKVNVLVSHENGHTKPIVYEMNPTYQNLIGKIEHTAQMGALFTDFTLIKPGALHRANGGYLIIDAKKLLMQPFAWEGLKRVIRSESIKIENLSDFLSITSTVSLEPEEIPLNVKVILIGERIFYYLLSHYDPDFLELFKIVADFEEDIVKDDDNIQLYARLIASIVKKSKLRPFDKSAVARVIDESSRLSMDSNKLSIHMQSITDLLKEADFFAFKRGADVVTAEDIKKAALEQEYRGGRVKEKIFEAIQKQIKLINITGKRIGEINGLSVISLGQVSFGMPTRISTTIRLGEGKVIDVEREVKFGGPIHSKGVLILSGFLGENFGKKNKLSIAANIVFEQSYSEVDGDSASMAELCALISSISDKPIKQNIAITGSVNQKGEAQAIGGVNEKIEGFFEVCMQKGLTGEQGVIIPESNIQHLMLKDEVLDAIKEGKFHIYAVKTVSEAVEILTGYTLGERDEKGEYPENTLGYFIDKNLHDFGEALNNKKTEKGKDISQ